MTTTRPASGDIEGTRRPLTDRLRDCHLEYVEGQAVGYGPPINPDGPEAADEIERLRAALKWYADLPAVWSPGARARAALRGA